MLHIYIYTHINPWYSIHSKFDLIATSKRLPPPAPHSPAPTQWAPQRYHPGPPQASTLRGSAPPPGPGEACFTTWHGKIWKSWAIWRSPCELWCNYNILQVYTILMIIYYQCLLLVLGWLLALLWGVFVDVSERVFCWIDVACFKQAIKQNMAQRGNKKHPPGALGARPNSSGVLALLAIDGAFRLPKADAEASNLAGGCLQNTLVLLRKSGWSMESQFPRNKKIEFLVYTTFLGKSR